MLLSLARRARIALLAFTLCAATRTLPAQWASMARFVPVGSEADERARLEQLRGRETDASYLFRSASTLSMRAESAVRSGARRARLMLIAPELRVVSNSALPFSLNDGTLWAGKGTSTILRTGLGLSLGPVRLLLAPERTTSENRAFQVIPYPQGDTPARNVWANPFHPAASSIDLPFRFGERPIEQVSAGQSSVTIDLPWLSTGVATENLWWGPGAQNAVVLSNNAAGFPHAFLQTRDGIKTPVGRVDAQWILGQLRESDFFDADRSNNRRSLSGIVAVFTPSIDSAFSLGMARTVMAPTSGRAVSPRAAVDVFRKVGRPNTDPDYVTKGPRPDQLISFFARWVVPRAGFEAWTEWARFEEPASIRDLLEFPGHSQGYTLGLQWAHPLSSGATMRVQAEGTNLEPDASIRVRPVATTYTSRAMGQGYTNRGKSLGASIGPGSSSQFVQADLFGVNYRFGVFASRIRWDNATLWEPIVPQVKNEDISLLAGVRGSLSRRSARLLVEYTHAARLGYLYQDKISNPARGEHAGVDFINRTLSVTLSTFVGR